MHTTVVKWLPNANQEEQAMYKQEGRQKEKVNSAN
jgi:hypothetical protein